MSEFAEAPFSRMVQVESYAERSDGYYWPEANVRVEDLAKQMRMAAETTLNDCTGVSKSVRDWALERLDSGKNFSSLLPYLRQIVLGNKHRYRPIQSRILGLFNIPFELVGRLWRLFLKL